MEKYRKSPSMELQTCSILIPIVLGLASEACWKWLGSRKGLDSWSFNLKNSGRFKFDFQRKSSSLSFNGEGLGLLKQSLRARFQFLSKRASIYRPLSMIFSHFHFWKNLKISLACLHGRVIGPLSDALRSKNECNPCWNHVVKPCTRAWKVELEISQMVLTL